MMTRERRDRERKGDGDERERSGRGMKRERGEYR
jgi:hypothetical protein